MSKSSDENSNLKSAAEPILAKEEESEGEKVAYKEETDEKYGQNLLFFHCFMLLNSFYLSMLLTNWGSANVTNNVSKTYEKYLIFSDEGSMWVKFSALWITVLIYLWTLFAPKILSDRDFS